MLPHLDWNKYLLIHFNWCPLPWHLKHLIVLGFVIFSLPLSLCSWDSFGLLNSTLASTLFLSLCRHEELDWVWIPPLQCLFNLDGQLDQLLIIHIVLLVNLVFDFPIQSSVETWHGLLWVFVNVKFGYELIHFLNVLRYIVWSLCQSLKLMVQLSLIPWRHKSPPQHSLKLPSRCNRIFSFPHFVSHNIFPPNGSIIWKLKNNSFQSLSFRIPMTLKHSFHLIHPL